MLLCLGPSLALLAEQGGSWQLQGLAVASQTNGVQLKLDALTWENNKPLLDVDYWCPNSLSVYPLHQCSNARLSFNYNAQAYTATVGTVFDFEKDDWLLDLSTVNEQLAVSLSSSSTVAQLEFKQLNLKSIISQLMPLTKWPKLPSGEFNGQLLFDLNQLKLSAKDSLFFSGLSYEYSDDIIVAELAGKLGFELAIGEQHLSYQFSLDAGEMLLNEVYVNFSEYPITVSGDVVWQNNGWYLLSAEIINQQSLSLSVQVSVNESLQWSHPVVTASVTDSHHFNQQILGSVLGIYGFGNSGMSGQFELSMASNEQPFDQWSIKFNDYYFLNERRKIASEALNGEIVWHQNQANNDSVISWQSLLLAGMPIGTADIKFNLSQDQFKLMGVQQFPVFNGAIELQELELGELFSESIEMSLNAEILPISLKLITEKMGWPIMSGSISGDIPGMVKRGSVIEFLGALDLKVFEGVMLVENLSLERLFGVAPVIAADVKFEGFDLSLLTETFGFGLITGKLSGVINDLRITNWKTDRLDAEVHTVKTKGVKQIISQRAIENISSLGGIKGAISKTFLRFFDDFRYKKIKLSCKLHNSVCEIGGIKNQDNRFVIVQGGGIPKINIVGYVRSINWEEFVRRLLNANYDN